MSLPILHPAVRWGSPEDRATHAAWVAEERLDAAAADDALPAEIDLDGHVDALGHRYLGKAIRQPDGTYHVVAIIGEALARVAVRVRAQKEPG